MTVMSGYQITDEIVDRVVEAAKLLKIAIHYIVNNLVNFTSDLLRLSKILTGEVYLFVCARYIRVAPPNQHPRLHRAYSEQAYKTRLFAYS